MVVLPINATLRGVCVYPAFHFHCDSVWFSEGRGTQDGGGFLDIGFLRCSGEPFVSFPSLSWTGGEQWRDVYHDQTMTTRWYAQSAYGTIDSQVSVADEEG